VAKLTTRRADRTALSGIAVQHADDGYSKRGNFGRQLVHFIDLIYSPNDTNIYGGRCRKFDGVGYHR